MTREEAEYACEGEPGVLFTDGYDDCIIGVVHHPEVKIVYDADEMIQSMLEDKEMGMDLEDCLEHMADNIEGAYVCKHTPIYVWGVDR